MDQFYMTGKNGSFPWQSINNKQRLKTWIAVIHSVPQNNSQTYVKSLSHYKTMSISIYTHDSCLEVGK